MIAAQAHRHEEGDVAGNGLRWEVENPTEGQVRRSRWLARHPAAVTAISAVVFAGLGLLIAALAPAPWLEPWLGALIGAVVGAVVGWGFSVENRPRVGGATKVVYVVLMVLVAAFLVVFKVWT